MQFVVRMDNNPLTYVMTTLNLDATDHRWIGALASYDFSLEYLKGRENGAADVLSQNTVKLDSNTVKALLDGIQVVCANRAEVLQPAATQSEYEDIISQCYQDSPKEG